MESYLIKNCLCNTHSPLLRLINKKESQNEMEESTKYIKVLASISSHAYKKTGTVLANIVVITAKNKGSIIDNILRRSDK